MSDLKASKNFKYRCCLWKTLKQDGSVIIVNFCKKKTKGNPFCNEHLAVSQKCVYEIKSSDYYTSNAETGRIVLNSKYYNDHTFFRPCGREPISGTILCALHTCVQPNCNRSISDKDGKYCLNHSNICRLDFCTKKKIERGSHPEGSPFLSDFCEDHTCSTEGCQNYKWNPCNKICRDCMCKEQYCCEKGEMNGYCPKHTPYCYAIGCDQHIIRGKYCVNHICGYSILGIKCRNKAKHGFCKRHTKNEALIVQ